MDTEIIEMLNERRKKKKIKITELANMADVSRKHVSEIFGNKKNPSLDVVCRLATALNMKLTVKGVRNNV